MQGTDFASSHGTDHAPNMPAMLLLQQLLSQINTQSRNVFFSKPFIVTYEIYTAFLLGAESGNSTFHFGVVLARMLEYLLRSSTLITEAAWPVACVQSRKQKIR